MLAAATEAPLLAPYGVLAQPCVVGTILFQTVSSLLPLSSAPECQPSLICLLQQMALHPLPSGSVRVLALDAAMPFDFEHRMRAKMQSQNALKIGIVGFGTFGQFLAKRFVKAGHQVSLVGSSGVPPTVPMLSSCLLA